MTHPTTCICNDCLPGGKREHRVRPWPANASGCDHPTEDKIQTVTRANPRLLIPTKGGGVIEQCRLCGTIVREDRPPVLTEPDDCP